MLALEVEPLPMEVFREWTLRGTLVYWFEYGGDITTLISKAVYLVRSVNERPRERLAVKRLAFGR